MVQLHALKVFSRFPHKYLTVFTDSRNVVTTLLNPQRVYASLELLRPMWSILEHYQHCDIFGVPRSNSEISKCDTLTRTDIVVPKGVFLY